MRTFGTIIFGLLFIVAFAAFTVANSFVGYPTSTSAIVDTAKEADMYHFALGAMDVGIREGVRDSGDTEFAKRVGKDLKGTLEKAIPEDWFYDMLGKAHAGFVAFLEGGTDSVEIDLAKAKKTLREGMEGMADALAKEGVIPSADEAKGRLDGYLKDIPDKTTLTGLISKAGGKSSDIKELNESAQMKDFQKGMGTVKTGRMVGGVIVLVLLAIIALIAMKTTKRLLVSVGVVLLIAGGVTLAGTGALAGFLEKEVKSDLAGKSGKGKSEREKFVNDGMEKLATVVVNKATKRGNPVAGAAAGIGLLMLIGGIVVKKKEA